jgi:predicted lipoprotein with Yx(FWY)xxD motif
MSHRPTIHTTTEATGARNEHKWILALAAGVLASATGFIWGDVRISPAVGLEGTMRFKIARAAVIAVAGVGALVGVAVVLGSSASAATSSCSGSVTGAPAGPVTVSAGWTAGFGRVLVVGSGAYEGCSLYLLTSDRLHGLTGGPYACSDNPNVKNKPCDSVLWPAVLTAGAPIAGPGVNPGLLGTVTRTDLPGLGAVKQVTYAGWPLYRFFRDEAPGETEGANLNDPVVTPAGIWYLQSPRGGVPATGQAELELETAPLGGTGPLDTVLAARMNDDYLPFPNQPFPVYTLNGDHSRSWGDPGSDDIGRDSACPGACAVFWPPVLTTGRPQAGPGVDQRALGVVARPDGSRQVTYHGRPLYLFNHDAYFGGASPVGTQGIYGAGTLTPSGVFNTIPPLP